MKRILSVLTLLLTGAFCFAVTKPVFLNTIMTAEQEVTLYKNASVKSGVVTSIPANSIVAIQKTGDEVITCGIKSNWVYVVLLNKAAFTNNQIIYKETKGWCPGSFLDNVNVTKNKFSNAYLIQCDEYGLDQPLNGKGCEKFYASEIVEADAAKTRIVYGQNWYYVRKLNSTSYSYVRENVVEKVNESEPRGLFGNMTIMLDHWEQYVMPKPYTLENNKEIPDGDYFVKKIYVNSVQNDLNTPFEYKKLALHVEGPVLWIYDTSTLRRFYNDNPNDWDIDETRVYQGRWNDCSWDECDSIFSEYLYNKMPCQGGYFWGAYYEDNQYKELFNPYNRISTVNSYLIYYKEYRFWQDDQNNLDDDAANINKILFFGASYNHGLQNEYMYVFERNPIEVDFSYDIKLPAYVMLKKDCKAYSTEDFTGQPDSILSANVEAGNILNQITLEEMRVMEDGVYYKAVCEGKSLWVYEYDLPEKSVFATEENLENYFVYICNEAEDYQNRFKFVAENLKLRSGEATSTEVITVMKAGTKVRILERGKKETIDGISSYWEKVEILTDEKDVSDKIIKAGTVGWCFGGYLKN